MVDVHTIKAGTVFAWFMLMMILRRVGILIVAMVTRRGKSFPAGSRPPEDNKLRGESVPVTTTTATTPSNQIEFTKDVRANRTIGNDSENDPYFLILLLATAVFSDSPIQNCTRTIVYGLIYLVVRIFYAIAYIMALQPWRSIIYAFGLAVTLACSLDLVITMSMRAN